MLYADSGSEIYKPGKLVNIPPGEDSWYRVVRELTAEEVRQRDPDWHGHIMAHAKDQFHWYECEKTDYRPQLGRLCYWRTTATE